MQRRTGQPAHHHGDERDPRGAGVEHARDQRAPQLARDGNLSMQQLPLAAQQQLLAELKAPVFVVDTMNRRVVEAKTQTKRRLGKSPDLADAFNLACFLPASSTVERVTGHL